MTSCRTRRLTFAVAGACAITLGGCAARNTPAPAAVYQSSCGTYPGQYATGADGHGCATAIILERMVANPADLVSPAPLPLPYGDAAIAPVQRHRDEQARTRPPPSSTGTSPEPAPTAPR